MYISIITNRWLHQLMMKHLGVEALLRVSFCYFNTREEIDLLVEAVKAFIKENE